MGQDNFKNIKSYLLGQMSTEESEAFEHAMKQNPDLEKETDIQRVEMKAMEYLMKKDLVAKMEQWEKERKPRYIRFLPAAAAAATIILAIGYFTFLWIPNHYSNQSLAINSWKKPSDLSTRRDAGAKNTKYAEGDSLFTLKMYSESVKILESIPETDQAYYKAQRLLGHSYFHLKEYNRAEQHFKLVITDSENSLDEEHAEWGLLLSYLATNNLNEDFYKLINKIIQNPIHSDHLKAKRLMSKLESFWRKLVF